MRTFQFFDNVDVSTDPTSQEFLIDCGQDMRFLIQFDLSSVTGVIRLFIEESVDGTLWTSMTNPSNCESYFELDPANTPIGIKDNYFMGDRMRLRIDSQGATGTLSDIMGYKTKV